MDRDGYFRIQSWRSFHKAELRMWAAILVLGLFFVACLASAIEWPYLSWSWRALGLADMAALYAGASYLAHRSRVHLALGEKWKDRI